MTAGRPKELKERYKLGVTCEKQDDEVLLELSKRLNISKSQVIRLLLRTTFGLCIDGQKEIFKISKEGVKKTKKIPLNDMLNYVNKIDIDKAFRKKFYELLKENTKEVLNKPIRKK